jgi:hypothetical protein
MQPITGPLTNFNNSDYVLAQTTAAASRWTQDLQGAVYDEEGTRLGPDLVQLGVVMRALDWFVAIDARATGINWRKLPDGVKRSAAIQATTQQLDL